MVNLTWKSQISNGQTHPEEPLKSKHSPFSKKIHRIMISYLTSKIFLHSRQNNFYAIVNASSRGLKQRRKKSKIKETEATAIMLQPPVREKFTRAHGKKIDQMILNPCSPTYMLISVSHPLTYPISPSFVITIKWT